MQTGADTIATDDIGGVKHQRVKVEYGADGSATDVSATTPLPVTTPDGTTTGTITATDTVVGAHTGLGAVLTGTPTANSYVAFPLPAGASGFTIRLSGTFGGGTVWMESSVDSTNGVDGGWVTNLVRQSGMDVTFLDASLTAAGVFRGVAGGYAYLRVRSTGATTPSVTVAMRVSAGPSVTALVASLPSGANNIGALYPTPSYTIGTTTGTTVATTGQIGRAVRATANVAQTTAATFITAPAAGTRIYVTSITCANEGATLTVARLFAGSLPAAAGAVAYTNDVYDFPMAGSGGGATINFPPGAPWALPAATALSYAVTVATTWTITVNYYVAA